MKAMEKVSSIELNGKSDANGQTNRHEMGRLMEAGSIGQIGTNRMIRDLLREMQWEISNVKISSMPLLSHCSPPIG